jgi:hypothetical protein
MAQLNTAEGATDAQIQLTRPFRRPGALDLSCGLFITTADALESPLPQAALDRAGVRAGILIVAKGYKL